jgi:hypothetical protein
MQIMPYTAKDLGIGNVYFPDHYKETLKKHERARFLLHKYNMNKTLLLNEAAIDFDTLLGERRIKDMGESELKEMKRKLCLRWAGLTGLEKEVNKLYGPKIEEFISDIYVNLSEGVNHLYTGDLFFDKVVRDAYLDRLEELAADASGLKEDYEKLIENAKPGTKFPDRISNSISSRKEYYELKREIEEGYNKYVEELKEGIFVGYNPNKRSRPKKLMLKPIEELEMFDERFVEEINVDRGVLYLARLAKEFNGNMLFALSAYNAGIGNVYEKKQDPKTGSIIRTPKIPPITETLNFLGGISTIHNLAYSNVI